MKHRRKTEQDPIFANRFTYKRIKARRVKWTCFIGFILFSWSLIGAADATVRYVSPTGSGSSCTALAPCSVNTGAAQHRAGDTLIFKNGSYDQALTYAQVVSGASDVSRSIYMAETPGGVTLRCTVCALDGGGGDTGIIIWVYAKQWVTFSGFVLDGSVRNSTGGSLFYANDDGTNYPRGVTLQNSEVKNGNGGDAACTSFEGRDNKIIDNKIHGCTGNPSVAPFQSHGVYISVPGPGGSSNALVERNEVYDGDGYCIHLFHPPIDNAIVRYNYCHDTHDGILLANGSGSGAYGNIVAHTAGVALGIRYGSTNGVAYSNTLYANGTCVLVENATTTTVRNNRCPTDTSNCVVEGVGVVGLTQDHNG